MPIWFIIFITRILDFRQTAGSWFIVLLQNLLYLSMIVENNKKLKLSIGSTSQFYETFQLYRFAVSIVNTLFLSYFQTLQLNFAWNISFLKSFNLEIVLVFIRTHLIHRFLSGMVKLITNNYSFCVLFCLDLFPWFWTLLLVIL